MATVALELSEMIRINQWHRFRSINVLLTSPCEMPLYYAHIFLFEDTVTILAFNKE